MELGLAIAALSVALGAAGFVGLTGLRFARLHRRDVEVLEGRLTGLYRELVALRARETELLTSLRAIAEEARAAPEAGVRAAVEAMEARPLPPPVQAPPELLRPPRPGERGA
jgi:hypothetical protein